MSKKISLLHATRNRADKAIACRNRWLELADHPEDVEHIFGVDDDDVNSLTSLSTQRVIVPHGAGCVAAWNKCAEVSTGEILIQLSDDWEPFQGWDTKIIAEFAAEQGECVLAINDGSRTDDLLCMAILNRARYVKQGFMFHPSFKSVFSDDYFTWAAKQDNVIRDARHIVFEHMHPVFGKAATDSTYEENNAPERYAEGHRAFNKLTRPSKSTLCLAMIVKNEINNMRRCLESVKDFIDYWVICDTGSTDGTQELIKGMMAEWGIPGELHECPWVDFAANRTESLALAKDKAGYTLVIDADDYLEVTGDSQLTKREFTQDQYHMRIMHGNLTYYRPQVVCNDFVWQYIGVLHEYLEGPKDARLAQPILMNNVTVRASASDTRGGFSGKHKYINDALVLERALLDDTLEPTLRTRYTFYQAQSYRDAGDNVRALAAYEQRIALGIGWEEEIYYSKYMVARLKHMLGYKLEEVIDAFTRAWEYRPSRVDALYDLIRLLGEQGRFTLAYAFASIGIRIPPTTDTLFVRQDVHQWRMVDDYAILAMRTGNKQEAIKAATAIVNSPLFLQVIPEVDQTRIKSNLEAFHNAK